MKKLIIIAVLMLTSVSYGQHENHYSKYKGEIAFPNPDRDTLFVEHKYYEEFSEVWSKEEERPYIKKVKSLELFCNRRINN